jgi:antitoxin (DNA-binding transcriptional repressor) of toxin-antitoxin stability system
MTTITIADIEGDAASYFGRVQAGESLLVLQADRPIAEIKPVTPAEVRQNSLPRRFGLAAGEFVVPDDFNAPLPEEILRDFEGR